MNLIQNSKKGLDMKETNKTMANTIQAWRDPAYRAALSEAELAQLPENPAGMIELTGTALDMVAGGWGAKGKSSRSNKSSRSHKSSKSHKSSRSHRSNKSNKSH